MWMTQELKEKESNPAPEEENTFPLLFSGKMIRKTDSLLLLSELLLPGTIRCQQLSLYWWCGNVPCWGDVE